MLNLKLEDVQKSLPTSNQTGKTKPISNHQIYWISQQLWRIHHITRSTVSNCEKIDWILGMHRGNRQNQRQICSHTTRNHSSKIEKLWTDYQHAQQLKKHTPNTNKPKFIEKFWTKPDNTNKHMTNPRVSCEFLDIEEHIFSTPKCLGDMPTYYPLHVICVRILFRVHA